jgi:hypothetical protein
MDFNFRDDSEAKCCCVVIWARNPDHMALEGAIRLEELQDRPRAACRWRGGGGTPARSAYDTIIHIDQVTRRRHRQPTGPSVEARAPP